MNSSGISRRIDELGRIVIPVEIRRGLNIKEGENLEFNIKNNEIILSKKSYLENDLEFLCKIGSTLNNTINGDYFITDRERIIVSSDSRFTNNELDKDLINLLNVHNESVINIYSISDSTIYIYPYYSDNNITGLIGIYNIDNIEKYKKLVSFITTYIRNRISLS